MDESTIYHEKDKALWASICSGNALGI